MRQLGIWRRLALILAAVTLVTAACGDDDGGDGDTADTAADGGGATTTTAAAGPTELVGLFTVTAGDCAGGAVTAGSYFRMAQAGGTAQDGPFIDNGDSTCGDTTFTALTPGDDGGLITGEYQEQPDPPFDDATNGTASAIITPTTFFGIDFAMATNPVDPADDIEAAAPSLTAGEDGTLTGDLGAIGVAYADLHFNQGAPKPDGSTPAGTSGPEGTYDEATGEYTLDWTSPIIGGPFDGFTGIWHFEGTFEVA